MIERLESLYYLIMNYVSKYLEILLEHGSFHDFGGEIIFEEFRIARNIIII